MTTFALSLPVQRVSPVHVPRRDLVLGHGDSLVLALTIIESDHPDAAPIDLTGGLGGPALWVYIWPDFWYRGAWDYGGPPMPWRGSCVPGIPLWSGAGVISTTTPGTFNVTLPAGTLYSWPRRCAFAVQLDWNNAGDSELIAEGKIHLRASVARTAPVEVLLTDTLIPVLTDQLEQAIFVDGTQP